MKNSFFALILLIGTVLPAYAATPNPTGPEDPTAPLFIPQDETSEPDAETQVFTISDADRSAVAVAHQDKLVPDGDPYWGANIGYPGTTNVGNFEADTHKPTSILSWGQSWETSTGAFQPFQTSELEFVRSRGKIPLLTWDSWQPPYSVTESQFQLSDIIAGTYDSYIRSWATSAKTWGHPFFLRFEHEMNGDWYPWSERTNGNSAGQFVTMWRHVHNIFTSVGATNVVWVWCPNISGRSSTALSELYPGDSYVDWTCLDGYNWGGLRSSPWQTITQVFRGGQVTTHDSYAEALAAGPSKPMMIGETASTEKGGSKADWISSALTHELPANMPQVKALVYYNIGSSSDWPIETSPSATSAFANGISGSYWEPNVYGNISSIDTLTEGQSAPAATVGNVTLHPTQDSWVKNTIPDSNQGGNTELQASDSVASAYMQFDLSGLAGHSITGAKLNLHTNTESWAGSASRFDIHLVQSGWGEYTITWNNRPALSATVLGSINQPASPNVWYSVSLSPSLMTDSALNIGLSGSTSDFWAFNSRESSLPPSLDVTYQ